MHLTGILTSGASRAGLWRRRPLVMCKSLELSLLMNAFHITSFRCGGTANRGSLSGPGSLHRWDSGWLPIAMAALYQDNINLHRSGLVGAEVRTMPSRGPRRAPAKSVRRVVGGCALRPSGSEAVVA